MTNVLPTNEFYEFMKTRGETPTILFQLVTRNLLRKYFTLSYQISNEYEYEISKEQPERVVLEAWKKSRKGKSVTKVLDAEEARIIHEITDAFTK